MKRLKKTVIMLLVISSLLTGVLITGSAANDMALGACTVTATHLNVRSGPGTSHSVVAYADEGDIVVIYDNSDAWYKINYNGTLGYVNSEYLTDMLTAENFNATGTLVGTGIRMRSKPDTSSEVLGTYTTTDSIDIIGINNKWFKVKYDGKTGYIRSDFMELVNMTSYTSANTITASNTGSALGQEIANFALQYVGYKYVYGAESPNTGFDCSGLVYYTYSQFGYSVSRTASQQYKNNGVIIDKADLQPGDLVFFSTNGSSVTHVGIYIGDNQFVHASTSNTGVIISSLGSAYYTRVWFAAKRVI